MKKILGYLLILLGALLILISIMALVKAFDVFNASSKEEQNFAYVFGSIVFPLLLTVFGRWVYRRGKGIVKG